MKGPKGGKMDINVYELFFVLFPKTKRLQESVMCNLRLVLYIIFFTYVYVY